MKKLILFCAAIFCFQASDASHAAGGELWYEHDTLNSYVLKYRLYRDCSGAGPPTAVILGFRSNSLSIPDTFVTMPLFASSQISTCGNTCINPSSSIPGYDVHEYSLIINLPGAANDWYFFTIQSARNPSTNTSQGNLYVDATLDNLNTPFNNSAFPYLPIDMVQIFNNQTTLNLPTLDIDGDSLDFYFTNPLDGSPTFGPVNLTFNAGYTVTNPFGSTPAPLLDPLSGNLTLYQSIIGHMNFAVRIDEYRSGVKIASTIRDYQFLYKSNGTNSAPALSGINNSTSYITSINACPNAVLSFTVNSSDANPTDSSYIIPQYIPTGALFTANSAQNQVGTFTWTPTVADVRSQPYIMGLKVRDDYCGVQSYGYQIFINHCNIDSVWAGDANADFTCDNYDILNIGIANGTTGIIRAGATTNWQAEWCANWTNNFISNINYKHADCNGDGVVNATDLLAVAANYGQIHTKTNNVGQYKTLGFPDLFCDVSNVQAQQGSTVSIPVHLGSIGSAVNDFYGISATVELLNAQTSAPISVSKNLSWIGNASNSFEFEKSLAATKSAFTFVRNDQTNLMAQQGQIGEIIFPIDAASTIGSKVIVQFSNIKMIKNTGEEINDYNVLSDTMTILAPQSVSDFEKGFAVNIYPNPTKSNITIDLKFDKAQHCEIVLYDLVGRVIDNSIFNGKLSVGEHQLNLDLSTKAQGQYLLEVKTENGKTMIAVQKH